MINNMPECPFKRGQVFKNPDDALMMVVRVTLFVNGWVVYYVTDDNQKGHFNQNNTDIIHNIELLDLTPPQSPNRAVLDALIGAIDELNRRNSYDVQYKTTQVLVNVHKAIKDYEESK